MVASRLFALLYMQDVTSSLTLSSSSDLALCCQVETKLADGDVTGEMHLASSSETLAPLDNMALSALQSKHPSSPSDLEFTEPSDGFL